VATPPPARSPEQYQAGQTALVALIPTLVTQVWPLLDVHDIAATRDRLVMAIEAIVHRYGAASAAGALNHYRKARRDAGVTTPLPSVSLPPAVPTLDVDQVVGVSLSGLYGRVTPESEQAVIDQISEGAAQLVLDQSRDTVIEAVHQDRVAKGWVRVTEPGACWFCTMLALRGGAGFLYRSEQSAGRRSNSRFTGGGFSFKVHNSCRCHAEPVWTAYEPSARMRDADRMWRDVTKGRSGKDAQRAFRQAWEGRTVTGVKAPDRGPLLGSGMTRDQIVNQLRILEGLKDSTYRTRRLAELRGLLAL
jgi:hypothetical protein